MHTQYDRGALLTSLLCIIVVAGSSCSWTGDHLSSPTHKDDGLIPSPPRYVRILEWRRSNLFRAEFKRGGRWSEELFMIASREDAGKALGNGWYAPSWPTGGPLPELTPEEESQRVTMSQKWPVGTTVELDYPLVPEVSKAKIGQLGDEAIVEHTLVTAYAGAMIAYLVTVERAAPDALGSR